MAGVGLHNTLTEGQRAMNKREWAEEMADRLDGLGNGDFPKDPSEGLCRELDCAFDIDALDMKTVFAEWPLSTGNVDYPVPHPDFPDRPWTAYHGTYDIGRRPLSKKWGQGVYAAYRRDLCRHCAEWIRDNMDQLVKGRGE
jgi:hypothetical protein